MISREEMLEEPKEEEKVEVFALGPVLYMSVL